MNRFEIFSNYLDSMGFDLAPMAWHMSGMPLSDEQHTDLASMFKKPAYA